MYYVHWIPFISATWFDEQAGVHVRCPVLLSDIKRNRNVSTVFSKLQHTERQENSLRGPRLVSGEQTDMKTQ